MKSPARNLQRTALITQACRLIEQADNAPPLQQLAGQLGVSSFHFHRLFKQATGLTPRQYALAQRQQRLRQALDGGSNITTAILDAGYQSNSRFYEKAHAVLGMNASRYRAGGVQLDIRFAIGECSLGSILVAQSAQGVCAILLGDDPEALAHDLQDRFPSANLMGGDRDFEQVVAIVVGFIETPRLGLDLPLDIRGTAFQQRVWQALQKIPPGSTASYAEIAARIGAPHSVRAVANACAANTLAVAIPCHRVVRTDGGLSGYRWGVARKRALLDLEAQR
ncbi:MAG: bifunctional DNA-binding transcriptional regulator/O6-methylguanine-DNA methyltransferase Ada [Steroidobacteraceae bacterium]